MTLTFKGGRDYENGEGERGDRIGPVLTCSVAIAKTGIETTHRTESLTEQ